MTMADLGNGAFVFWPWRMGLVIGAMRSQPKLVDADGEGVAVIMQAPKTGTISKIGWRTETVTTGGDIDVRVESVDLTTQPAPPSGTLLGTNSNIVVAVAATDDNKWFLSSLTTGVSVTRGDKIAVLVKRPTSSTFVGNISVADRIIAIGSGPHSFPYLLVNAGSWAIDVNKSAMFAIEYSDGSYPTTIGIVPGSDTPFQQTTFNSGSTPDEIGIIFQLPIPFRLCGFWHCLELDNECTFRLYDSDGSTVLDSYVSDPEFRADTTESAQPILFSSDHDLSASTNYRLAVMSNSTSNIEMQSLNASTAAMLGQLGSANVHRTSRTDSGAWSQTTTNRPPMGILISGFDDAAGGGGGLLTHPGMVAGMRG